LTPVLQVVSQQVKEKLKSYYKNLNPVNLRKKIEKTLNKIYDRSQKHIPECDSSNRDEIMAAFWLGWILYE
jgi:hypothetical protein